MKSLHKIQFGFSDAENYRRRENRELFNRIFLRTDAVEQVTAPHSFFLVGEKGSGKTAYAVYLSNSKYKNFVCSHHFIRETDYQKFIAFKGENNLSVSDYVDVWRVILLLMLAKNIDEKRDIVDGIIGYPKFRALRAAIDEYYGSAFSPEIQVAMQFVENNKLAAELLAKYMPVEGKLASEESTTLTVEQPRLQTNLRYIEKGLIDALSSLRLSENHILFVDGIDIRPTAVAYDEYLDCVKGLANAAWSLNNDVFPAIRDSKGRLKVVLLLRPDIFNSLGLQNRNTKLKDNSVLLNWITTYPRHRESDIFKMADRMFSSQQDVSTTLGAAWDYYFPFDAGTIDDSIDNLSSFVVFLRYSFHRPRDILAILDTLQDVFLRVNPKKEVFQYQDLMDSRFRDAYGIYFLGEIRDSLSFYYDEYEIELFLKFFEYLDGRIRFSYEQFMESFVRLTEFLSSQGKAPPSFMRAPEEFLQFMFDQNVICFIEKEARGKKFFRWCFIERNVTNIAPKVQLDRDYEIHYGLVSALNLGKIVGRNARKKTKSPGLDELKPAIKPDPKRINGVVKFFAEGRNYGFIESVVVPGDLFFHRSSVEGKEVPGKGVAVTFELSRDMSGKLVASSVRSTKG